MPAGALCLTAAAEGSKQSLDTTRDGWQHVAGHKRPQGHRAQPGTGADHLAQPLRGSHPCGLHTLAHCPRAPLGSRAPASRWGGHLTPHFPADW